LQRQGGNFLLQALLALTLVFAFIPFFAKRLSNRDMESQMYAVTKQVETVKTAAKIYVQENEMTFPYKKIILEGTNLVDVLENYGLPLGFVPYTKFNQNIMLTINKTDNNIEAYIDLYGNKLSGVKMAELSRRLGLYATPIDQNIIRINVPLDSVYTDIVIKKEKDIDNANFLSDLNLGKFNLNTVDTIFSRNGVFETTQASSLIANGVEQGRKDRNRITTLNSIKTVFQSFDGNSALSLTKGVLTTGTLSAKTISKFGDGGNLIANIASVYNFEMSEGKTSFYGPLTWNVHGSLEADKVNFSVERLDINGNINASSGQNVYVNLDSLEYNLKSGIEVGDIYISNITLKDQTSYGLASGSTGSTIVDIRPANTSVLPDIYLSSIDTSNDKIISQVKDTDGNTTDCKSIIADLNVTYNQHSLSQYIICQYVFWQRLENRIDIKQCLLDGKSDCL